MYQEPNKSPWGAVQTCDTLCPGVFLVSTASHGGTMVSNDVAAFLSPAANPAGVFFFHDHLLTLSTHAILGRYERRNRT